MKSLAVSQMQCIAAKLRLLEGQENEPAATAGAKESSGRIWITTGKSSSTLGPGLHSETLRKFTMETQAEMRHVALPPTSE